MKVATLTGPSHATGLCTSDNPALGEMALIRVRDNEGQDYLKVGIIEKLEDCNHPEWEGIDMEDTLRCTICGEIDEVNPDDPVADNLISFARQTLGILERDEEWSPDTIAYISSLAFNLGVAHSTDEQEFVAGGKPSHTTSPYVPALSLGDVAKAVLPVELVGMFHCVACGREELDCSKDPCSEVREEREETEECCGNCNVRLLHDEQTTCGHCGGSVAIREEAKPEKLNEIPLILLDLELFLAFTVVEGALWSMPIDEMNYSSGGKPVDWNWCEVSDWSGLRKDGSLRSLADINRTFITNFVPSDFPGR